MSEKKELWKPEDFQGTAGCIMGTDKENKPVASCGVCFRSHDDEEVAALTKKVEEIKKLHDERRQESTERLLKIKELEMENEHLKGLWKLQYDIGVHDTKAGLNVMAGKLPARYLPGRGWYVERESVLALLPKVAPLKATSPRSSPSKLVKMTERPTRSLTASVQQAREGAIKEAEGG